VIAGNKLISDVGNFRAVRGLEFFHNAAEVHLYGALPHLQLVGNDLVRFALANSGDDCGLPRREYPGQLGLKARGWCSRIGISHSNYAARRKELTTRSNEPKGLNRHIEGHAR
jgi:hypothetical protein